MAKKEMHFAEYEERILGLPSITLRYIIKDATEAMAAQPEGENASYYSDEIMVCGQELSRRVRPRKRTNRESEYHNTLTEIAVILNNAGREPREMLDELRKLAKPTCCSCSNGELRDHTCAAESELIGGRAYEAPKEVKEELAAKTQ